MTDDLSTALARAVQDARAHDGISLAALAERSGVSRAMIARIERGDVQPTAALLARLSAGLGLTLSELIARAEGTPTHLRRADDQPVWTDPDSGYTRRALSPPSASPIELVEVSLPPGATVSYPADTYRFIDQQVWMLHGTLRFTEGSDIHELHPGDCLQLGEPTDCTFENSGTTACRYLVAITKTPRGRA